MKKFYIFLIIGAFLIFVLFFMALGIRTRFYCENCGSEITDIEAICYRCGWDNKEHKEIDD